jgi:hypothetical protein
MNHITPPIPPIVVRPVQLEEVSILLEIIRSAYAEYDGWLTPPSGAHNETVESLTTKVAMGAGAIAWDGDHAVGSVLYEAREHAL